MNNEKFIKFKSLSTLRYIDIYHKSWNQIKTVKDLLEFKGLIEVYLYTSTKELSNILGLDIPDWVVGLSFGKNIYMKEPSFWGENAFGNFTETLIHEIFHTIANDTLSYNLPIWLNEGLAINIASQTPYLSQPVSYDFDISDIGYDHPNLYQISAYKVKDLIDQVGLEQILDSIKKGNL